MSEPFVGEIRMFAGSFAPRGWAFCDGQLLAVSQNDALFSLFGTVYGGDGRTTFGLPDLRGRLPIHAGAGPGLSTRALGAKGGAENVTLTSAETAAHTHDWQATTNTAQSRDAVNRVPAAVPGSLYTGAANETEFFPDVVLPWAGLGRSHTNLQPFLCVNFIVALFGIYPSRN